MSTRLKDVQKEIGLLVKVLVNAIQRGATKAPAFKANLTLLEKKRIELHKLTLEGKP